VDKSDISLKAVRWDTPFSCGQKDGRMDMGWHGGTKRGFL